MSVPFYTGVVVNPLLSWDVQEFVSPSPVEPVGRETGRVRRHRDGSWSRSTSGGPYSRTEEEIQTGERQGDKQGEGRELVER